MDQKIELKKWIADEFPSLTEEEIVEAQSDYSELVDWLVSVSVEDALTETQNDDTVKIIINKGV